MTNENNKKSESLATVHTHTHTHGAFKKERLIYLDILNILAIIAVIAMHCNGIVHGNPMIKAWNTSLAIECLAYFAVPVFFMISGANLMKYRERYTTKEFYLKRMTKVLVPFIFWAIVMFLWKIFVIHSIKIESVNSLVKLINAFFSNTEEPTYYFMFEILGIYLIMPLLSLLTKKEYHKTLWLIVATYFIFNATIPNLLTLVGIRWNSSFGVPIGGYVMYAIIGYLLSETCITKKQKNIIYIGAILGLCYRYVTTFVLSKNAMRVIKTTWGYTSWHCILLSMAVFIFVKDLKILDKIKDNDKIKNIIAKIAGCSFGVYLIHIIIKYYYVAIFNINVLSWHFRTLGIIAIYVISLAIVMILKKVPIIKKILP